MRMFLVAVFYALLAVCAPNASAEDSRATVSLPPEIHSQFMAEMRAHMATLHEIVTVLGEGDFQEAANIAEIKLDFGHRMWERMAEQGIPDEQIIEMKAYLKQSRVGMGRGQGQGQGVGRYMPEEFRAIGQTFHQAGADLAKTFRAASTPPTVSDYQSAIAALSDVTTACRGCHDAFRVE